MTRLITRLIFGLLVVAALVNAGLFAAIWLTQDPAPRPLDAQRIFVASRPAVVLVQANYHFTASVPEPTLPAASKNRLERELVNMVASGRVAYNQAAVDQAALNLLLGSPDAYFTPGSNRVSDDVYLVTSGTGFFVTEDGYLVTASHVVSARKDDIRAGIIDVAKDPGQLADSRKAIKREVYDETGLTLTDSQLEKLVAWQQRWYEKYMSIDSTEVQYYLGSGTVEAGQNLTSTGTRLSLVKAEDAYPGRDVAVMKADVTSVPAVRLAAADPKPSDKSFVVGYPRKGYLDEEAQMDATVPPTLTTGTMSGASDRDGGWKAFGTNAQMDHGNSGGPVFDGKGEVMGMASYGEGDANGELVAGGTNYFVPAPIIRETLSKSSVTPAAGTLTNLHYQALSQSDFHHYRHELAILSQVQSRSPWASYIKDEVSAAQSAVLSGKDQTPPELRGFIPAGLASLGVTALLAAGAGMWFRLRRRREAQKDAARRVEEALIMEPQLELISISQPERAPIGSDVPNGEAKDHP